MVTSRLMRHSVYVADRAGRNARILRGGCWILSCRWCRYSLLGMHRWCKRASHLKINLIDRPKILKARPADLDRMTSAQPTSWHLLSFSPRIYILSTQRHPFHHQRRLHDHNPLSPHQNARRYHHTAFHTFHPLKLLILLLPCDYLAPTSTQNVTPSCNPSEQQL